MKNIIKSGLESVLLVVFFVFLAAGFETWFAANRGLEPSWHDVADTGNLFIASFALFKIFQLQREIRKDG